MSTQRTKKMITVMGCALLLAGAGCMGNASGSSVSGESSALKGGIPAKGMHTHPDAGADDDQGADEGTTGTAGAAGDSDEDADEGVDETADTDTDSTADEDTEADESASKDGGTADEDESADESADGDEATDEAAGDDGPGDGGAGMGKGHKKP